MIENSIKYNKVLKWKLEKAIKSNSIILITGTNTQDNIDCANYINNLFNASYQTNVILSIEPSNYQSIKAALNMKKQFIITKGTKELTILNNISSVLAGSSAGERKKSKEKTDLLVSSKIKHIITITKHKNSYRINVCDIGYSSEDSNFCKTHNLKFI